MLHCTALTLTPTSRRAAMADKADSSSRAGIAVAVSATTEAVTTGTPTTISPEVLGVAMLLLVCVRGFFPSPQHLSLCTLLCT